MGRLGVSRRQGSGRPTQDPAVAADGSGGDGSGGDGSGSDGSGSDGGPAPETLHVPGRIPATLAGARHPLVAILLLMSFFTVLSGKPVDGLLLFSVASALSWDAGLQARRAAVLQQSLASVRIGSEDTGDHPPGGAGVADRDGAGDPAGAAAAVMDDAYQEPVWQLASRRPSARLILIGMALAIIYVMVVGSFTRYSWPATFGIVAIGATVVVIGWGGPIRRRTVPGKFTRKGVLIWSTLLVSCGLWELSALMMQPNFETSSYDHPTISTLTDPLLATPVGRSFALLCWLGLGLFLVLR